MTVAKKLASEEVIALFSRREEAAPVEPPVSEEEAKIQVRELIRRHKKALDALAKL